MLRAELPCGQVIYLRQSKTDPNAYQTLNKQMAAVIDKEQGDVTLVGACCGEFRYRQGRLYQIKSPDGRVISLVYNGNLVTEIREEASASAPFKLVTTSGGVPTGMYVNGKLHTFELGKRPRVENTNGTNVIAGFDPSLSLWNFPDRTQETYEFEVGEDVSPNLKMTERDKTESNYVWNTVTGHIVSDGVWTYTVGKMVGPFDLPKLNRVNSKGEEEFRYVDMAKGITEVKNLKQGHTITEVFLSSGALYGKVRKIEKEVDGKRVPIFQAGYDEMGRLVRETNVDGFTTIISLDEKGNAVAKKLLPPRSQELIDSMHRQEMIMLKAVSEAKSGPARGSKLKDLAFFYLHRMKEPKKALALLEQMTNAQQKYIISLQAIAYNYDYSCDNKIEGYKRLLGEYPKQHKQLEWMIAKTQGTRGKGKL